MIIPFLLIVLFILLHPTLSPIKKVSFANNKDFINFIIKSQKIIPQQLWEYREFTNTGSFNFSKTGLPNDKLSSYLKENEISLTFHESFSPFLSYTSNNWHSFDYLVPSENLDIFVSFPKKNILFQSSKIIVAQIKNTYVVIFILPSKELETSVGYFDYKEKDISFLKKTYWLSIHFIKEK